MLLRHHRFQQASLLPNLEIACMDLSNLSFEALGEVEESLIKEIKPKWNNTNIPVCPEGYRW